MVDWIRRLLTPLFVLVSSATEIALGRNLRSEWKGRSGIVIAIASVFVILGFLGIYSDLYPLLTGQHPASIADVREMGDEARSQLSELRKEIIARQNLETARGGGGGAPTQFQTSDTGGIVATFDMPLAGKITEWELFFAFTTGCENDLYADLTSPAGRSLIVMNRGLHRCTGIPTTFSSRNNNDVGAFVGSEARGDWRFTMRNLDGNESSSVLEAVWMTLTVNDDGLIDRYIVSLDGLPRDIPNPS